MTSIILWADLHPFGIIIQLLYKARVEKSELEEQLTIAKNCEAHLEADLNAFKVVHHSTIRWLWFL